MSEPSAEQLVYLPIDQPIWERFFAVFPLVLVGSKEESGYDLAPKHMAIPLGWDNFFCFVCSPRHATYHNVRRHPQFTVSYPRPAQIVSTSLAAAPRAEDQTKPSLQLLPTFPARHVDGVLVKGCYLYLECSLHGVLDGFGPNSLIIGQIVGAAADERSLRNAERDENEQVFQDPLLAYVHPGRLAEIRQVTAFPFPVGFRR